MLTFLCDSGYPFLCTDALGELTVPSLEQDMVAYDGMKDRLEEERRGKWVLIHDEALVDVFDTFHEAADTAISKFGSGPYHIRQIGETAAEPYPASLRFRPA